MNINIGSKIHIGNEYYHDKIERLKDLLGTPQVRLKDKGIEIDNKLILL